MRLQRVELSGRRFLIQFGEIIQEFGQEIPWLEGLNDLRFITHPVVFRDRLLRKTRQDPEGITPYQFVEDDRAGIFVGGVLHFRTPPERFIDHRNIAIMEQLVSLGSNFISCLQIRSSFRDRGYGRDLMTRSIRAMLREHGSVWGVVSEPKLIPWYEAMGAIRQSPMVNRDQLWILLFPTTK